MAIALVTGGSGGIGAGIVERLVAAGHAVAVGYASSEPRAREVVDSLTAAGANAILVHCDIAQRDSIDEAFAVVESTLGAPEILVNNAGVLVAKSVNKLSFDDWDLVIRTNLDGTFAMIKRALPAMREARWGRIVNISSPAGSFPYMGSAAYGASKAAINLLTRVLALEVARRTITVNCVSPAYVQTPMVTDLGQERLDAIAAGHASPRPVRPDEVGNVVAFLASDEAAMVTGQDIAVHGGGPIVTRPIEAGGAS